jgi:ABC-type polysaccharide/polyol phosphate export permease
MSQDDKVRIALFIAVVLFVPIGLCLGRLLVMFRDWRIKKKYGKL